MSSSTKEILKPQPGVGTIRSAALALLLAGCAALGPAPALAQEDAGYFEFGKVVALGRGTIDVQTFDESRRKLVQHSFLLTRETRADKVQVGDAVEIIYAPATAGLTLRRVVLLSSGFPVAGPPPAGARRDARNDARLPAGPVTAPRPSQPRSVALPTAAAPRGGNAEVAVNLGNGAKPRVSAPVAVPLGAGEVASVRTAQPREIARDTPSEECNRSALDWPTRPISLAVLDFRYPTEREESHESGTTGGGSGTAVADLTFAQLEQQGEFALSRGDRQKLYRADFAGAARLGRQMGVDAVLAGTFVPIEGPLASDGFPGPKTWELRAGVVDTCTGQLLLRLYSQTCVEGAQPGQEANESQCRHLTVTAKQAMNPEMNVAAFQAPINALLYPLQHNTTPAADQGDRGTVLDVAQGRVTLRLTPGTRLKAGDEVAIHATRLTKNPVTYTLQTLHDQEIGRLSVTSVQGNTAIGSFAGEIPPRPGDVAVDITQ